MNRNHAAMLVACLGKGIRASLVLALGMMLLACGSSEVVRQDGAARAAQRVVSQPKYGATVAVQRGDTLYRIAVNNRISPLDLAIWNRIAPPYTIYPGQRLRLYPSSGSTRTPVAHSPSRRPPTGAAPRPMPPPVASAPVASPVAWRWPADGQLIGRYVSGEATKQGIDIAGSSGQAVRAAGDGVIVYSGSGLVGYGELIIVKHDDAWLSAYGHNRARMVNEGQLVKAGQQIAEMGRSGAARDMLHFEIRFNGKPVDPLRYLPQR